MRRVASYGGDVGVPASRRLKLRLSSTAGMHLLGAPEDASSHILHKTSRAARNLRIARAGSELSRFFFSESNSHPADENGARIENTSAVESDTLQFDTTRQLTPPTNSLVPHTIDDQTLLQIDDQALLQTSGRSVQLHTNDDQTFLQATESSLEILERRGAQEQRVPEDLIGGGIPHVVVSAVVKIQSGFRGFRARQLFLVEKQRKNTAATNIQLCFRAQRLRKRFLLEKQAACMIQAHTRGFLLRRVLNRWGASALTIQNAWRSHQVKKKLLQEKNHALGVIQACTRGFLLRRVVTRWTFAACLIQTAWRSHRARKNFLYMKNSASLIQSQARGVLLRREVSRWRAAAGSIQRAWRSYQVRKIFLLQKSSASLIQALARGFLLRRAVSRWRTAARSIQRAWRFRRHLRNNAAELIQANVRGFLVRRVLSCWKTSACRIQRAWRIHQAREHQKSNLEDKKNAARIIQAHARGFSIRRELNRRRFAASSIQNSWRFFRDSRRGLNGISPQQASEQVLNGEPQTRPVAEDWNSFDVDRVVDCLDTCLARTHSRAAVPELDLPERDHQDDHRVPADESRGYKQTVKELKLQQLARLFLLQHQVAIQQQRAKLSPPFPPQQQECKLRLGGDLEAVRRSNPVESQDRSGDIVLDIQFLLEEVRKRDFSLSASSSNSSCSSSSLVFMGIESGEKQAALVGLKQINTLLVVFVAVVIYTRSLCHGVFLWAKQSSKK